MRQAALGECAMQREGALWKSKAEVMERAREKALVVQMAEVRGASFLTLHSNSHYTLLLGYHAVSHGMVSVYT